jgi:hypothetical protein
MTTTLVEAVKERDEAVAKAFAAADEAWKNEAIKLVEEIALYAPAFTADDLWLNGLSKPREPRALGGVLTRCAANGIIEKSGQYLPSVRRHATPIPVWKSLVYTEDK